MVPGRCHSVMLKGSRPYFAIFVLVLLINGLLGHLVQMPTPAVHDEFAYLLGGDTFSQGRLTTPTHELWEHFQTYHVIQRPTYQSKYPPAQSMFLALGQLLTGHPIHGAWIGLALATAATVWMLQCYVPMRWAFFGGVLIAFNPRLVHEWGQTYFGGAPAMLGGALTYGSIRVLAKRPMVLPATFLALGLWLLANARPYEGLVAVVPGMTWLFYALIRTNKDQEWWRSFTRSALVATAALCLGFAWMGYYNYRVTGTPWKLPYQAWFEQQEMNSESALVGKFLPRPQEARKEGTSHSVSPGRLNWVQRPHVGNPSLVAELAQETKKMNSDRNSWQFSVFKWQQIFFFFYSYILAVPIAVALPFHLRRPIEQLAMVVLALLLVAVIGNNAMGFPHYVAPATPVFYLISVQSLRQMRLVRGGARRLAHAYVAALPLAVASTLVLYANFGELNPEYYREHAQFGLARKAIAEQVCEEPGRHVVFVEYSASHGWHHEWIYNEADIDDAKVVWARPLSSEHNRIFREYFAGRTFWRLEADAQPPNLVRWDL